MELKLFKTLWGHDGSLAAAAGQAHAAGFGGLEGQTPQSPAQLAELSAALNDHGLQFIAEITTAGSYVPDRHASVEQHLRDLDAGLSRAQALHPLHVNCIGGCDAWPLADSLRFFEGGMALARRHGLSLSFETHRGRSLFNPWITRDVVAALPQIPLTADFSHWCVVCERLIDSELDIIKAIAPNVRHIHARVGYDQGPQVPHPAAPEFAEALAAHQRWWTLIWDAQHAGGTTLTTMTPEFGPDGYLHCLPFTRAPVADLWDLNRWVGDTEHAHFTRFIAQR
ncbi:sugar phosphate isomerase/epimerase [Sinimarinibacterium sp. CAU 1509]|uniref:sugar phosphate isomerase/epimerase family protein n=1 Tax=Sinimarinibacterium sp. CAU 1509 TaxID=2562283 RepID=UPI0010AB6375|nr:TIM barrel protein [Sinimarinibacterium sp. CAU 1509]TJY58376.1 sugar phosphate isomerase/epimerase [Sinimarinibacterium sp. CAU 1509]